MPSECKPTAISLPAGSRLSNRGSRPRTDKMRRLLRTLGVTSAAYRTWTGDQPLNAFVKANPEWTQRAWEVLILENLEALSERPA